MALEDSTDLFYFERCVLREESDCEFEYDYVQEDDGTKSVEADANERLEEAIKNVEQTEEMNQEEILKPPMSLSSVLSKPELPEDFVRNFLVIKGMQNTLDSFQEEWYQLQERGLTRHEECETMDDVYSLNLFLEQELNWLRKELQYCKMLLDKSKEKYNCVIKERDHHKIHHRRLYQEKERMTSELNRMKEHLAKYEPMVCQMSSKYQAAMKEKMLTRLELEKTRIQLECCMASLPSQPKVMHMPQLPVTNFEYSYITNMNAKCEGTNNNEVECVTNINNDNCNTNSNNRKDPCRYAPVMGPCKKFDKYKKVLRGKRDPTESKFPVDQKCNPHLIDIKLPAQFLSVYGGFKPKVLINIHALPITSVKVHPGINCIATTSDDQTWKLWNFTDYNNMVIGAGHLDWVADCDFSPCGKRIATVSGDTTIKIWDTGSATCLCTFMDHQKAVWSCSWHYMGEFLASSSLDCSAKIWDLNSLRCRYTLRGHKDSVNSIEFLHYSNILVTASTDRNICLWDARMNICGSVLTGHKSSVNHCKFNMKGNMVVSCDSSGIIMAWDLRTRKALKCINCGPESANMTCFDPSGTLVVVASNDKSVKVIEMTNEKVIDNVRHGDSVQCLYYDNAGQYFISGASDNCLIVWS